MCYLSKRIYKYVQLIFRSSQSVLGSTQMSDIVAARGQYATLTDI